MISKTHACSTISMLCLGLVVQCLSANSLYAATANFMGLGELPDGTGWSFARGVSDDGSTVVGYGQTAAGYQAFRWTQATGMVAIGGGGPFSNAEDVSADGSVVVGRNSQGAFIWKASGLIELGGSGTATAVSADGKVVAGDFENQAFRWTESTGMTPLENQVGVSLKSYADAISADGSIVVGTNYSNTMTETVSWNGDGDMVVLTGLAKPGLSVNIGGISADGSVIGASYDIPQGFRWSEVDGVILIPTIPGDPIGPNMVTVHDISGDGSTVVGESLNKGAYLWTAGEGTRELRDILLAAGNTEVQGWTLRDAAAISSNGRHIVGYGINPSGGQEAWIATIGVPEPNSVFLGAFAAIAILTQRKSRI